MKKSLKLLRFKFVIPNLLLVGVFIFVAYGLIGGVVLFSKEDFLWNWILDAITIMIIITLVTFYICYFIKSKLFLRKIKKANNRVLFIELVNKNKRLKEHPNLGKAFYFLTIDPFFNGLFFDRAEFEGKCYPISILERKEIPWHISDSGIKRILKMEKLLPSDVKVGVKK